MGVRGFYRKDRHRERKRNGEGKMENGELAATAASAASLRGV